MSEQTIDQIPNACLIAVHPDRGVVAGIDVSKCTVADLIEQLAGCESCGLHIVTAETATRMFHDNIDNILGGGDE